MVEKLTAAAARAALHASADPSRVAILSSFFKTGKGEYGEGDRFIGLTVPLVRAQVKRFADLPLSEVRKLLRSRVHEERLFALLVLVGQFERADERKRDEIYRFYLEERQYVNNWDLVDTSAGAIVGGQLFGRSTRQLDSLARSRSVWDRRIAMIATFYFIRRDSFDDALRIAAKLLRDEHDLIHKAVGWMLREIGKRDLGAEMTFLERHAAEMPRTMLRYAIERFLPAERKRLMEKKNG